MPDSCDRDVDECACLHKQITERVACPHSPPHLDLGDAVVRLLGCKDPRDQRVIRAAAARGRSASKTWPPKLGRLLKLSL